MKGHFFDGHEIEAVISCQIVVEIAQFGAGLVPGDGGFETAICWYLPMHKVVDVVDVFSEDVKFAILQFFQIFVFVFQI